MYLPYRNTFIVEIPKCGSQSFLEACDGIAVGHYPFSQTLKSMAHEPNPVMVAVIRDPADRFVSAVNYRGRESTLSLDAAMRESLQKCERKSDPIFVSQATYADEPDEPHERRLFAFEEINDAFSYLGVSPKHENKHSYKWCADDIVRHPLFEKCMETFTADYALRIDNGLHQKSTQAQKTAR